MKRALDLNPAFLEGWLALADLLMAAGELETAERALLEGIKKNPNAIPLLAREVAVAERLGRLDRALDFMEEIARLSPKDPEAQRRLAKLHLVNGKPEEAERAARRAVELAPRDPEGHFDLGIIYESAGRPDAAKKAYRRGIEVAPAEWKCHTNLGLLLSTEKGPALEEALKLLERASHVAPPEELAPRLNLALALYKHGDARRARAVAQEVAKAEKGDPAVKEQASRFLVALAREGRAS
jgi:Flp pilus assembly protein TadD